MKIALGIGGAAILAVSALWWRLDAVSSQRDEARIQRDTALQGLNLVLSERDRADAIVSALNDRLDLIRDDGRRTRQAISELERSNEDVRDLLDTRLPLDLAGVLWDQPAPGGDSGPIPARTRAPVQSGRSAPD
jgi:hypothetical protein